MDLRMIKHVIVKIINNGNHFSRMITIRALVSSSDPHRLIWARQGERRRIDKIKSLYRRKYISTKSASNATMQQISSFFRACPQSKEIMNFHKMGMMKRHYKNNWCDLKCESVFESRNHAHPLMYKDLNLCTLYKKNSLVKKKIAVLKKICEYFGISPSLGPGCPAYRQSFWKFRFVYVMKILQSCTKSIRIH